MVYKPTYNCGTKEIPGFLYMELFVGIYSDILETTWDDYIMIHDH